MNIRNYWQQGAEAYREIKHQQTMEKLDAELNAIIEKQSNYSCKCEKVDAFQCYADKHHMPEENNRFCKCRCHKTAVDRD